MNRTRPRRAWAAAATIALAMAGAAGVANAAVRTLVGVGRVTFSWQPASGQPSAYLVSRSLNGAPPLSYAFTTTNQVVIPVTPGDQIQISVRAQGYDSTGAVRVGPASPLSDPVHVLPAPQFPGQGRWLLNCASCPRIESRWIGDASVVARRSAGLPAPWVVLGNTVLGGRETIVWHNPQTGEIALWDWLDLVPIGVTALGPTALRGVGGADLDGDGIKEFLTQRTDTLGVSVWSLTATGFRRVAQLSGPPGAWLAAARDFDRDGRVDLLWHNPLAGTIDLARFTANPILGIGGLVPSLTAPLSTRLGSGLSANAQVASTGDYDGDRSPDVLLRYSTGALAILYLDRGAMDDFVWLPSAPDDVNRVVVDSRNVDGLPGAEIALQHRPTGELSILDPLVTSRAERIPVLTAGSKWEVIGAGS